MLARILRSLGIEIAIEATWKTLAWLSSFPAVAGFVGWMIAKMDGWPLSIVYLATLVSVACGCIFSLWLMVLIERRTIFRGIMLVDIKLFNAYLDSNKLKNAQIIATIHNKSHRDVYMAIYRADWSLQNQIPSQSLSPIVVRAADDTKHSFNCAPIIDIDLTKEARGHIDIEIRYGAKEKKLTYCYSYKGELALLINQTAPGVFSARMANAVRDETHSKRSD